MALITGVNKRDVSLFKTGKPPLAIADGQPDRQQLLADNTEA